MNLSLPRGLSHNPFSPNFVFSGEFPWKPPLGWQQVRAANSIIVNHRNVADSLLTASILDRNSPSGVRSLMVTVPQGASLAGILEAATYEAAKRWIKDLAKDISPFFTMHPTDAILVMRLLLWSEGSVEAVEFALRSEKPNPGNIQQFTSEFDRKRDAILEVGTVTPSLLLSWISLRPPEYNLTQLLIVQTEEGPLQHIENLLRWAAHYHSLNIKIFLAFRPMNIVSNTASEALAWTVRDLEAMVDQAVGKVSETKSFDGIEGMAQIGLEMKEYLGEQSLLSFLADHANGSITQLMTYCNAILQAYQERTKEPPGEEPSAIVLTDVIAALELFGLKHDRM